MDSRSCLELTKMKLFIQITIELALVALALCLIGRHHQDPRWIDALGEEHWSVPPCQR